MALLFVFSLVTANPAQILAAPKSIDDRAAKVVSDVYPTPQRVDYISDEGMNFEGNVNVVLHGNQEHATLPKLEEILKGNNINYTVSDTIDNQRANILISSSKDHCGECTSKDDVLLKKEAYVLKTTNDVNTKGEVTIIGSDEDGAYYGVLTLGQILEQRIGNNFAEILISDYPEIEFRGFIEGFYGFPWSHEERMNLMRDSGKFKMNTYVYAPKDDPYHRAKWRELYPEKEAKHIAELAQAGKNNNFNFCWTIHPGDSLNITSDADFQATLTKLNQLYDLGVRQFGILFDDIDNNKNGRAQGEFINRVDDAFIKTKNDVEPLITVGTRYCAAWGPDMQTYLKPFIDTLHDDIQIMWTGDNTVSNVSKEVFDWPKQQVDNDRDLAVWWNYPVNDHVDERLLVGELAGLENDLDNVSAFFSNPMNQAESSKVSIFSIADYTWNVDAFNSKKSWERSIEELVPDAASEFKRFAANIGYMKIDVSADVKLVFEESVYLNDKIETLKAALGSNGDIIPAVNEMLEEFKIMESDYTKLTKINNKELYEEIKPFLGAYHELAKAGINALESIIAANAGNSVEAISRSRAAQVAYDAMSDYTVHRLENTVEQDFVVAVGTYALKPIVQAIIDRANAMTDSVVFKETNADIYTNKKSLEEKAVQFIKGGYVASDISTTLEAGDYVGIELPGAKKVNQIEIIGSGLENLELEYSLNGTVWSKAEVSYVGDTLTFAGVDASYIKLINNTSVNITVEIETMRVMVMYKANPVASTNIEAYSAGGVTYAVSNVIDGDLSTKFWSNGGIDMGKYVQVDLGKKIPLYDIKAFFLKPNDYLIKGEICVSEDSISWTSLGELSYEEESNLKIAKYDANGIMARYIRVQPVTAQSWWLQVFEIEYNKDVNFMGNDTVELALSNTDGNVDNLYDKNLATAFAPTVITEGSELTYKIAKNNIIEELTFIQDGANISEGIVSVKDSEGNWVDLGNLDKEISSFAVDKKITEVKVGFDLTKPLPKIYELIVTEVAKVVDSNKEALKIAVEVADEVTTEELETVVDVVAKEFKDALKEAKEILENRGAKQEVVDKSFDRLSNAMHFLSFKKGDKKDLEALVARIKALESDAYLEDSWTSIPKVIAKAEEVIADKNALVEDVKVAHEELVRAFLQLRLKPNKDLLEEFINQVEGLKEADYTKQSWKGLQDVVLLAKAVYANEQATQTQVTEAETVLKGAFENLVKVSEKTEVDTPKENINNGDNLSSNAAKTGDTSSFAGVFVLAASLGMLIYFGKKRKED